MDRIRLRQLPLISVTLFALLPALFFAVLIGFIVAGPTSTADRMRGEMEQSVQMMQATQGIAQALDDAETGQRGYLITGMESYLDPYTQAVPRIPQLMSELQRLSDGRPDQQQRILRLQGHVTGKLRELARTVDTMRKNGYEAARAIVLTNVGRNDMDSIRQDLAELSGAVNKRLDDDLENTGNAQRRLTTVGLAEAVICLLSLLAGGALIIVAYRRRLGAEQVLQATLDSVREGIAAFDSQQRLVAWNQLFVKLLRLPGSLIKRGLSLAELESFEKSRGANALAGDLSALDTQSRLGRQPIVDERELPDGTAVLRYHNSSPDGGFVTTYTDVTERRYAERVARHAQKMEALGQMTGGIAHDFNNLLTVIIGNLDRLRMMFAADAKALRIVDLALMGADRGAKLTHQLLAFARRQPLEPRAVNLIQLLPDLTDMLRRSLGEHVEIETIGTGGLWNTLIDPNQFESAVLNLAINARDAMPSGGKLTLEVANVWLDETYAARHEEVQSGQYVMFGVTDTGTGMPAEIAARAFDPFFTTKGDAGTGLGLSMVYGFVKQSGGHAKIYSEAGHGTTIKLYLPRAVDAEAQPFKKPATGNLSGTETVLAVEDEDTVRETVVDMLEGLGYRVLQAPNGAVALTLLESGEPVDLLFTDVIMPGSVSSKVLAARAMELLPGIKVLFTSGYTENTIVHNGRLNPGVQLISKPYGREQLAIKIRTVLGRSSYQPAVAPEPAADGATVGDEPLLET